MHSLTLSLLSAGLAFLAACSPAVRDIPGPSAGVTRQEALRISRAYTEMRWTGNVQNVRHGCDPEGIRIDTPDVTRPNSTVGSWWFPGAAATGMPYKWGGFDTPRQFVARLAQTPCPGEMPVAAGDMGTVEKQQAGDAVVSRFAAGVDCSGFISRCWRLDRPWSTRELPALCTPLASWDDLKMGDILIIPGQHVLMFIKWDGKDHHGFTGSESGPIPVWKCAEHSFNVSRLLELGYRPMRYRNMTRR